MFLLVLSHPLLCVFPDAKVLGELSQHMVTQFKALKAARGSSSFSNQVLKGF